MTESGAGNMKRIIILNKIIFALLVVSMVTSVGALVVMGFFYNP